MMRKLILLMRRNGYAVFSIYPDVACEGRSVIRVHQDLKRMGISPQFWLILDHLDMNGSWGTNLAHQLNTELPEGTYLTFA